MLDLFVGFGLYVLIVLFVLPILFGVVRCAFLPILSHLIYVFCLFY